MENETLVAKLRNQLTPLYGLANSILMMGDNPDLKPMIVEMAKQALSNKEMINSLLAQIESEKLGKPAIENFGIPEWLTEEIRKQALDTWNSHKTVNDNLRVEAVRIIQRSGEAAGYTVGIKKASELFNEHCLRNEKEKR